MRLGELLDAIRDGYVLAFAAWAKELAAAHPDAQLVLEPALLDADGDVLREGDLDVGLRVDGILVQGGATERLSFDSNQLVRFEPFELGWGDGLTVHVSPFSWDSLDVRVTGAPAAAVAPALRAWFERWFRHEEDGADAPQGLVHFVSPLTSEAEAVDFNVDLGTASVEAFEQLLDAMSEAGASDVVLGADPASSDA